MAITNPPPSRRRWRRVLGVSLIAALAATAVLPWLLGTGPARRWLLARADRALAPARLEFATVRFSWFGPTRFRGFALRDAQGDRVVSAPGATWDRNLRQILFERPRLGTFTLDRADLDVERRPDGSIDLYEALRPVIGLDPRTDLVVRINRGRLRFRVAGQPVPVTAEEADLTLRIAPAPGPLSWQLRLATGQGARPATLQVRGDFDRWPKRPDTSGDLTLDVEGHRWPWAVAALDLQSSGRLEGGLALRRRSGLWTVSGRGALADLDATGPRLAGDHLRLDLVSGSWQLSERPQGWAVERLDVTSALGTLRAAGAVSTPAGASGTVEGTLDLAALARQLPHALRLREGIVLDRGSARVRAESRNDSGGQTWEVEARVSDLLASDRGRPFTLREPATLTARLARRGEQTTVEEMAVRTAFLSVTGRGDVDRGIALSGTVDLAGLRGQLRDLVDFGAVELAGRGDLSGHYRRARDTFEGRLSADLRGLRMAGLGPAALERDAVRLDLSLAGSADESGLPRSWSTLRAGLASGDASADLSASSTAPGAGVLTLAVKGPAAGRRAEGRLDARWDGSGVDVDRLRVGLVAGPGERPVALEAKGRYDSQRGEIVVVPSATDPGPRAIALAAEGIRVSGLRRGGTLRVSAALAGDVEALVRLARPSEGAYDGPGGTWSARATADAADDGLRMAGQVDLIPISTSADGAPVLREDGRVTLAWNALRPSGADRLDVAELVVSNRYATLEGSGRVSELGGRRLADLRGTLNPHWQAINALLAERIEPGARVSGKPRAWRVGGPLAAGTVADLVRSLELELGFDLSEADVYGLHLGPTPIVVRGRRGTLGLDPIDATLNGGRVHLEPELALDDDGAGARLRLGPTSTIEGAEINDEVSRRFLSYVAPVLDRATRAHGRVSVALKEAVFPIGGAARRSATVDGQVVFQDVEFLPGPFAEQLFDLVGLQDRPSVKLDEPVAMTIADRRVYHHGLALPLGKLTRIELEGWVDFDRNIRMTASLPITPAMVGNAPVLSELVQGKRVSVPIAGTLRNPQIDGDAINLALKDLGKSFLDNEAVRGAAELLMRLRPRRDPNAPPPPTPQERRARRMERKAQRRGAGG